MEKDKLEQFIVQHKDNFDLASPSPNLWASIEEALPPSPKRQARVVGLWRFVRNAAATAAILVIGISIGRYSKNPSQATAVATSAISEEYVEMERFFQEQVQEKKAVLASYNYNDHALIEDLQQLDHALEELKSELPSVPLGSEEIVIDAMIQNYETKIRILERVLNRIQSTKRKNSKNGTIDL